MYTFEGNLKTALSTPVPPSIQVGKINLLVYPQRNVQLNEFDLTASFVSRVFDSETQKEHIAIVSYNPAISSDENEAFRVRCGDKHLAGVGRMGVSDEDNRRDLVLSCEKIIANLGLAKSKVSVLVDTYGMYQDPTVDVNGTCKFYTNWRRDHVWCAHTNAMLAQLNATRPNWKQELKSAYEEFCAVAPLQNIAQKYAFRVPVLLEGPQGSGKTTTGRLLAEELQCPLIEIGGHQDMESAELMGYLIQAINDKGQAIYVWKDGPLSKAFRLAKKQKVVVLFDELRRVPTVHLSVLLTALSPTPQNTYRLATNRALAIEDGVADIEVLECPIENLAFIATTNVGMDYVVHEQDKALESRFIKVYMPTTVEGLKGILKDVGQKHSVSAKVLDAIVAFFNAMTAAHAKGLVADVPSTRHLVRALEQAKEKDWESVKEVLRDQTLSWVASDSDGAPVPEQIVTIEKILDNQNLVKS